MLSWAAKATFIQSQEKQQTIQRFKENNKSLNALKCT